MATDDVSLIVVLLDTNPFFWAASASGNLPFSNFLNQVIPFLNSLLLLNQHNQVVLIATGVNSCDYIYDSAEAGGRNSIDAANVAAISSTILNRLENFVTKDARLAKGSDKAAAGGNGISSLLSGSLSIALCCILFRYIQRVFRSGARHPEPRGSPDGPEQYVAVMNAIFSAQRSMLAMDGCGDASVQKIILPSPFLPPFAMASYITGGVYLKPQHLDGLFQYLAGPRFVTGR
ncbi:General transcription factor IIH subunit 3 [Ananas comosus]|uniref:General transcription and DNA repair factor IIH subunit TFB4 n=1 Tax=Ananas comosus TaxID=4615 RepID=A0A199UR77_ANACO|nr:General transcription factor IIH subunit 3 [Ananas comosus]